MTRSLPCWNSVVFFPVVPPIIAPAGPAIASPITALPMLLPNFDLVTAVTVPFIVVGLSMNVQLIMSRNGYILPFIKTSFLSSCTNITPLMSFRSMMITLSGEPCSEYYCSVKSENTFDFAASCCLRCSASAFARFLRSFSFCISRMAVMTKTDIKLMIITHTQPERLPFFSTEPAPIKANKNNVMNERISLRFICYCDLI